jgi:hypothetical protein
VGRWKALETCPSTMKGKRCKGIKRKVKKNKEKEEFFMVTRKQMTRIF